LSSSLPPFSVQHLGVVPVTSSRAASARHRLQERAGILDHGLAIGGLGTRPDRLRRIPSLCMCRVTIIVMPD